jgi:F-type H+-transporting ATPase subunit b
VVRSSRRTTARHFTAAPARFATAGAGRVSLRSRCVLDTLLHSLNIDPKIMLMNGVLFLVLLFILNGMFWKPMMAHLEQRKHDIQNAYKTVDDTRREMEQLRTEYQARLNQIEAEARGQIQETVRDAQAQREELIVKARQESEAIIGAGERSLVQERENTLAGMRATLDQTALTALSKALGGSTGPAQQRLVDEFISKKVSKA